MASPASWTSRPAPLDRVTGRKTENHDSKGQNKKCRTHHITPVSHRRTAPGMTG